ncbi:glucose 1-dehydrogenase [Candidatus Woesearchaeota archaeon]|nr:glucose 1-dehydrogenase [Candidatus Woesearchaeota archaeon]
MKAITVIPGEKYSADLRDVPIPSINENEVLIRSTQVGICGTDREIHEGLYGTAPKNEQYLILGHESSGVVAKVGKNVSGISIGQRVVRLVRRPCSGCENCNTGMNDMCSTGNFIESGIKELHGSMAEYFKDQSEYLISIPHELCEVSVLLEPLSVVEKAYRQAKEIQQRLSWKPKKALIMGAGPIGILQAMLLRDSGLDVSVVARSLPGNRKSKIIEKIGAQYLSTSLYSLDAILKSVGKVDFVVEASGDSQLAFDAMSAIGNNGVVCLTSITGGEKEITIPADKINLDYVLGNKVAFGTVNANQRDYVQGVRSLERFMNQWPEVLPDMITRRFPLVQFEQAFQLMSDDIKVILKPF